MGICASSNVVHSSSDADDIFGAAVVYCSKTTAGRRGSAYSLTGSKGLNQDSAILYQGYGGEDGVLCAVFDGHGQNGHAVSNLVRNHLPELLLRHHNNTSGDGENNNMIKEACVISAFTAMDKDIKILHDQTTFDLASSGSTAALVIKHGEELVVANLGDSRAILGQRSDGKKGEKVVPFQLTTDLKPGLPCEAERIRKCKGRVLALKEESHILRVWLPYDDSPGLAMSRAFGDFMLKQYGVIATPDISYHHLSPDDEFLVIATDGVWDVLTNETVVSIVSSARSQEEAAKLVVEEAAAAWESKYPNSRRDDCTVVCLFLR
ncbi:probable protein phosphatase 2C 61 [Andrographis paniculata]|uniref:probable protein phosphatase 2C 61 n=1 Tax=Andrographis paniculata TaxID=175694 RepID=UPI0021E98B0A|nr:probable protein phosphatase 2C 61 [Andrographis paniculata]